MTYEQIWFCILLLIGLYLIAKAIKNKKTEKTPEVEFNEFGDKNTSSNETPATNYSHCYQAKYILTKNEWYEYKKLKKFAEKLNLQVCPKIRMLDIIEPRKGNKEYTKLLYKIQAKHVDFVICDRDLRIKGIIELDDNSHKQKERQERDKFVDEILTSVGYKIVRTNSITEETLNFLLPVPIKKDTEPISREEEQLCDSTAEM